MRAPVFAALLLWGAGAGAAPAVRAGGDLGLLLRQEAGGNRSVLPALTLRGAVEAWKSLEVGATWTFAYASGGGAVASARTQHHRLGLRAEYALGVRKAQFVFAAGPALVLMRTGLYDRGEQVRAGTLARAGGVAGVALQVPFERFSVRTGADLVSTWNRWDWLFTVGGTWRGGGP